MKFIAATLVVGACALGGSVWAQQNVALPAPYSYSAHARKFLKATIGPQALLSAMAAASMRASFNASPGWGDDFHRYENHLEGYLARRTIQQSIEFGVGALVKQDGAFTASQEHGFRRRLNAALYHSFFVPGAHGTEFAYPRVAAAMGTAFITDEWHPWRDRRTDPWVGATTILSSYVAKSIWQEFKPDVFSKTRRLLRLH